MILFLCVTHRATMPRAMMRMTAKLTGIRAISNIVMLGSSWQPCGSVQGAGVEVEKGERGDDVECMLVVVANLQSIREVEEQDLIGGEGVVFGCISSATKESIYSLLPQVQKLFRTICTWYLNQATCILSIYVCLFVCLFVFTIKRLPYCTAMLGTTLE